MKLEDLSLFPVDLLAPSKNRRRQKAPHKSAGDEEDNPRVLFCRLGEPTFSDFSGQLSATFPANPGRPKPVQDHLHEALTALSKSKPFNGTVKTRRRWNFTVKFPAEEEAKTRQATEFEAVVRPYLATSNEAATVKRLSLSPVTRSNLALPPLVPPLA